MSAKPVAMGTVPPLVRKKEWNRLSAASEVAHAHLCELRGLVELEAKDGKPLKVEYLGRLAPATEMATFELWAFTSMMVGNGQRVWPVLSHRRMVGRLEGE